VGVLAHHLFFALQIIVVEYGRSTEFLAMLDSNVDAKAAVLQAVDIVDLIGKSVALKRRGKDFVGLCPFHSEKSPSFKVDPARQYFFCFGCKTGGDAITYVMKRDRVEFFPALQLLAEQAGIELPRAGGQKQNASEKQALLAAHSASGAFFSKLLGEPAGTAAREYLEKRQINAESIQRFGIGLAPDGWDGLLRGPVGKQYSPQQLVLGGLVKAREGGSGFYDTFRSRLMFPIRDDGGRTIAFGGRVLPGSTDPAKYLNSPETPLFSKSRCIFGLDLARQKIVETRTAVIVEGYTDVVVAHQCGVSNVVSVLGTALTPQHAGILRRFADRIVLLFDADTAGDAAVEKAVGLLLTQPVEILIATMPQGMDPDEFLLSKGAAAFAELVAGGVDALSFKWKQLERRVAENKNDLAGQQRAVEEYLGLLASARTTGRVDPMRWGAILERVSRLTGLPVDQLHRRFKAAPVAAAKKSVPTPYNAATPYNTDTSIKIPIPAAPRTARDHAEEWILGVLLLEPQRWHGVQTSLSPGDFQHPICRALAEEYWHYQRDEGEPVLNEFVAAMSALSARQDQAEDGPGGEQLAALAMQCITEVEVLPDPEQTLRDALTHIAQANRLQQERKLLGELRRTDNSETNEENEVALLRQLSQKVRERAGQPTPGA
jgi:DNA primase